MEYSEGAVTAPVTSVFSSYFPYGGTSVSLRYSEQRLGPHERCSEWTMLHPLSEHQACPGLNTCDSLCESKAPQEAPFRSWATNNPVSADTCLLRSPE